MRKLEHRVRSTRVSSFARLVRRLRSRLQAGRLTIALGLSGVGPPAVVIRHGSRRRRYIALTFDDNRDPPAALATLQVLQELNVPATMFVTGRWVEDYPEVTAQIRAGGHEVGDHSLSHRRLDDLSVEEMLLEVGGGTEAFRRLTQAPTSPLFRPPWGTINPTVAAVAGCRGFRGIILWDVAPRDWTGSPPEIIEQVVLDGARAGSIVLMHLSGANTSRALPAIVTRLREEGYRLVTLSEMIERWPVGPRIAPDVLLARVLGRVMRRRSRRLFKPADAD